MGTKCWKSLPWNRRNKGCKESQISETHGDNTKHMCICIIEVTRSRRDRRALESISKNWKLSWERKYSLECRRLQSLYKINLRRNTLRNILIKLTKIKIKRKITATREKQQTTYKEPPVRLIISYQQKLCRPERSVTSLKWWKAYNQEYSTQQFSCRFERNKSF